MANQNLRVNIQGNATGLTSALKTAQGKLKSFGSKLQGLGNSLQAIAVPMGLIGGAGIKMAMDFDKSMTKIKALVGLSTQQVDQLAAHTRKMALETGISSQEAGEALFFITSAGLKGELAMEALEMATKAAAAGLGETATIADLATSAMNAYGAENLNATQATDVLTAAVRLGKLAPDELAGAMGSVIPIASNMGIEFHEVGAAMAAMSKTGTNAAAAATQLNAIFMGISTPAEESRAKLAQLGMTFEELEQSVGQDGLMPTLAMLKERMQGTDVTMKDLFKNVRAYKGVLDLTGASMKDNVGLADEMTRSHGATEKAFKTTADSASHQFKASLNSAKETLTSLGQQLLVGVVPMLQKAAEFIRNLYKRFTELEPATQKIIMAVGLLTVALPTLITIIGVLVKVLAVVFSTAGLVVAALAGIAYVIYTQWDGIKKIIVDIANYFIDLYNESNIFATVIQLIAANFKTMFAVGKLAITTLVDAFKSGLGIIKDLFSGLGGIIKGVLTFDMDEIKSGVKKMGKAITKNFKESLERNKGFLTESAKIFHNNTIDAYKNARGRKKIELITEDDVDAGVDFLKDKVVGIKDKLVGMLDFGTGGTGGADTTDDSTSILEKTVGTDEDEIAANEKINRFVEAIKNLGLSVDAIMSAVGDSLMGAFTAMLDGENFVKTLGNALKQIIKQLIAAAMAALALSVILGGLGIGTFQGGGTGFKDIFGKLSGFGTFANGGIVSAPTMGLMGEYPGAKSNPEVIAPLDKLKNMIGNTTGKQQVQVGGSFEIRGQDLVVALERANSTRNRLI